MFQNYIKTALRNLLRQKLFSVINVLGLAIGLAACILIMLFVRDEYSYDQFWAKSDQIHRLNTTFVVPGREPFVTVAAPGPIKEPFEQYFSDQVAHSTRFAEMAPIVRSGDQLIRESVHWTDPDFADMFDLDIIAGDLKQALSDNTSLAVNRSFAEKYFGDVDPIGQVLTLSNFDLVRDYQIAAVFEDLPHNTVMDFQVLAMIDEQDFIDQPSVLSSWFSVNTWYFFELNSGGSVEDINSRMLTFTDTVVDVPPGALGEDVKVSDIVKYSTIALTDIQLNPTGNGEMKSTGDKATVWIFTAIAVLILLIACINFMNLATAKSTQRAREVALRKVMGARRSQLLEQFFGESMLLAILSLMLAIVIVESALPYYGDFLGKNLVLEYSNFFSFATLGGLVFAVGIVGGLYPALILSGFRPAFILKANKSAENSGSNKLRSGLVIVQFAISIALIVAAAVVYGQMLFATNMDAGFNKENLLVIKNVGRSSVAPKQKALRDEIMRLDGVLASTYSINAPASGNENNTSVEIPGKPELGSILIGQQSVDYEFFDTYQMPVLAGRVYDRAFASDGVPSAEDVAAGTASGGTIIVNEGALRRFGFGTPEEAIGKAVTIGLGDNVQTHLTIIGVVPDTNFQSLRQVIRPELFFLNRSVNFNLAVRYSGDPRRLITQIENIWKGMITDVPYRYEFVDEVMAQEFIEEQGLASMLGIFSGLAVVIACMGLYGLAAFTAERRTKEIGIRKVMGATVLDIVRLLVWQFSKPVLLASIIAWPIAIWAMMTWLESFPYRIDSWLLVPLCLIAAFVALSIAWATVGGNAAKVARSNPIKALRYE